MLSGHFTGNLSNDSVFPELAPPLIVASMLILSAPLSVEYRISIKPLFVVQLSSVTARSQCSACDFRSNVQRPTSCTLAALKRGSPDCGGFFLMLSVK